MRDSVTQERVGYFVAGTSLSVLLGLAWLHDPWWLLGALGISLNMMQSAITNRCVVKSLLTWLRIPSERERGRREILGEHDRM